MPRAKKLQIGEESEVGEEERAKLEEVRKKQRVLEAQKARERRANQSPEEVAARRMRDAQRARERRARLTPDQMAQQRHRDAILKRERRAKETEAEKAVRRSLEAQKARERRAKMLGKRLDVTGICSTAAGRMGLTHFMDLSERTDLTCDQNINDPLSISAGGSGLATEWIKEEVTEDLSDCCESALENIPVETELEEEMPMKCDGEPKLFNKSESDLTDTCIFDGEADGVEGAICSERTEAHQCDVCGKTLSSKGNVRLHKIKRHKLKTPFVCQICHALFDCRSDVIRHRNVEHRRESDGMFECPKCGKIAYEFHNFLSHMKIHSKSENTDSTSAEEKKCKKKSEMQQSFICELCGKSYKRSDTLNTHKMLVHVVDGGTLAANLKIQEKNYVCDTCGHRFAFRCLLRDHLNIHSGIKPYPCSECGRVFAQRASLKQHIKTHSDDKPFPCPECSLAFIGRGDLKKHMRKHTGERPFVCEVCGASYAQSSHLNVHRRSHTGERPFSCDICGRRFTKSSDVIRHKRIHTGELPFLCQVCGKGFRQSAQCANHIKNHHPETVDP